MRKTYLFTALATLLSTFSVQSQDAGRVEVGSFDLIPVLDYSLAYDNNLTRADTNEISSWVSNITPEVILLNNFGANQLQFGYRLDRGVYHSSQKDNYTDHFLNAALDYEINARHKVKTSIDWEDGHDDRGTRFSIGNGNQLNSPDQYTHTDIDLVYTYGVLTAPLGLDLLANYKSLDYDINTPLYRSRDRDITTTGATLRYELAPLTDFTLDYIHKEVDYDFALSADNPLDSTEDLFLLGIDWESTAQTSGYAKLGYRQKDFEAAQRDTFNGVDWQLGVVWEPVSYSRVNVTTFTNTNETNGEGNFIKSRTFRANWEHDWLERLSTRVVFAFDKDKYEGVEGITVRRDDNIRLSTGVGYDFRRWMVINLDYIMEQRNSNRDVIDYDRDQIKLSVRITL